MKQYKNSLIYANKSNGDTIANSDGKIINSTIYSNKSLQGAIGYFRGIIKNSIIWHNFPADCARQDYVPSEDYLSISNSCFYESKGENNNISSNPKFVNTSGDSSTWDLHLQNNSACVDSGSAADAPPADIDGNIRPGSDNKVCMGAYESPDNYETGTPATVTGIIYVSKDGNNSTGTSWADAFTSITTAINSLGNEPAEIWVKEGRYTECTQIIVPTMIKMYGGFQGIETSVQQREIENHRTIIDGEGKISLLLNFSDIDGFDFCGGYIPIDRSGYCINNKGIISNSRIYNNISDSPGYVICNYGTIIYTSIYNNKYTGEGGIIQNCNFLDSCRIYKNTNTNSQHDQNYYSNSFTIYNQFMMQNCIVFSNDKGVKNIHTMQNSTVFKNTLTGIYIEAGTVINSISRYNGMDVYNTHRDSIINSNFSGSDLLNGNNGFDPMFVNTDGDPENWDIHLKNESPCIDRGNLHYYPTVDYEGNVRPGNDGLVCMGAYESPDDYQPLPYPPDANRFYVSKYGDNSDGLSWDTAYTSVTLALNQAIYNHPYEIWVAEGKYSEGKPLEIYYEVTLIGGFAGTETSIDERNPVLHPSIIDGESKYQCVRNEGNIRNFFIINGYSETEAGGIFNKGQIFNCTIMNNRSAGEFAQGGGVYNHNTITNSKIYNNSAISEGGGIYNDSGYVFNCLIFNNTANSSGGGIYNNNIGTIYSSTLYSNNAPEGSGIFFNNDPSSIINTISWGNNVSDISSINITNANIMNSCFKESDGTNNNISEDPQFVNTSGEAGLWDFHLLPTSPCIDKGMLTNYMFDDYDNNKRPQGLDSDIGAYEYTGSLPLNAKIISVDLPEGVLLGKPFEISVTIKNTGTTTWNPNDGISIFPVLSNLNYPDALKIPVTVQVAANEEVTIKATCTITSEIERMYIFHYRTRKDSGNSAKSELREFFENELWFGELSTMNMINVYSTQSVDINNDDQLTLDDLVTLKNRILTGNFQYDPMDRADCNKDGFIDIADLILLRNLLY